jgi:lipid A disaccharide synthetase
VVPADILILSNGPGEVTTWVRPVVRSLRQQLGNDRTQVRISLVLSPCPNANGRELAIAQTYPEIDRVQGAEHFFPFLLAGKTAENWDWRDRGVVLFLGGDQFFSVVIGKRLHYRIVIYGEWETRWHHWVDRFGVMKPELIDRVPRRYVDKFKVVGDLMAEVGKEVGRAVEKTEEGAKLETGGTIPDSNQEQVAQELIGLLPGSKPAKLAQGVPLSLAIAQHIHAIRPQTRFVIPVAPMLDLTLLAHFADPKQNPIFQQIGGVAAALITDEIQPYLKTSNGLRVDLWTTFPAYDLLSQCRLCITTVGANTAELGSLAVPMIVMLPTQQLDAMRAWDGLPGLLANLPGVGSIFAKLINGWFLRQSRLLAWPNIWAGKAIVPELVGKLQPAQVAEVALNLLSHPGQLEQMSDRLRQVRGKPGAARELAQIVGEELKSSQL